MSLFFSPKLAFLWSIEITGEVAPSAKNNDLLVIRLSYGDRSILLSGDAEKQVDIPSWKKTSCRRTSCRCS